MTLPRECSAAAPSAEDLEWRSPMKRSILFPAVLAAVSLPAAAALARGNEARVNSPEERPSPALSPQADTKGTTLSKQDREFLDEAGQGGLYEVRAGQLAVQRAQANDVKQFGQRMIDDHTAVNGRLQKLAQAKGLNVPAQLDKKHQDKIDNLSKKTGMEFDKAYIEDMVDDHKQDVESFEKASKDAKDVGVKELATATLPTLREHLQQVQSIKDKLKL
jgi:putative membrane protein